MVKHVRIVFGPSDICDMQIVCKCGARVAHSPTRKHYRRPPDKCPSCDTGWWDSELQHQPPAVMAMFNILEGIHFLTVSNESETPFTIHFEIDGEE